MLPILEHACKLHGNEEDTEKCTELLKELEPSMIGMEMLTCFNCGESFFISKFW